MNKNALQRYKNEIKYVQKILESIFIYNDMEFH